MYLSEYKGFMSGSHAHHDHGPGGHHDHGPTPERALWVAILLNAAFLVLEVVAGLWTNSLALLSDAGHMVSDVGALIIALVAVKIAHYKPSEEYTFGLRRAPVLGGLINAVSLVVIVVWIGIEAVHRFEQPPELDATIVLWTGVAGLFVNLASAWYLARSRDESVNTRGAMLHLLSDALGSVAAIVSAVAMQWFGARLADPIASVIIGALILVGSWPLLRDTVRILLERAPNQINVGEIRTFLLERDEVEAILDFHIWGLDSGDPVLSAILKVREDQSFAQVVASADLWRAQLRDTYHIEHATLECRHHDLQQEDVRC